MPIIRYQLIVWEDTEGGGEEGEGGEGVGVGGARPFLSSPPSLLLRPPPPQPSRQHWDGRRENLHHLHREKAPSYEIQYKLN